MRWLTGQDQTRFKSTVLNYSFLALFSQYILFITVYMHKITRIDLSAKIESVIN